MALTRANTEGILVARCGPLLNAAGMAITVVGTNASLNDPIGRAVRDVGYTVTDITNVADADVAHVSADSYDEYLDYATLHALESILGNYDDVDITVGPRDERLSQTIAQIERKIARLMKHIAAAYGYGIPAVTPGVITLKIAEHGDDE